MKREKQTKAELAKLLGVSRQFLYYKHLQKEKDWKLKAMIEEVLSDSPSYGYRRIADHLKMNKKPIQRVMKLYGIKAYRRRGRKPKRNKDKPAISYPNLLFEIMPSYPNHVWATDFTYIWFKDRFVYVCTIIDLFTREIAGFSISTKHDRWLVIEALLDAIRHHPRPEIIHCDHGKEYTSKDYDDMVTELGITRSMATPGCPWENGYQESFYSQFKVDFGDPNRFDSLGEFTAEIYRTIHTYNHTRIHSAFGMSPLQFANCQVFEYNLS
jgi:transposase InsO family protein